MKTPYFSPYKDLYLFVDCYFFPGHKFIFTFIFKLAERMTK